MKKCAKLLAVLMALAMLAGVMTSCDLLPFDEDGNYVGFDKIINLITGKSNADFMETENYTVSAGMLKYYFVYNYMSFRSQYGQYLSFVGIDDSAPLDEQMYGQNGSISIFGSYDGTWFDLFMDYTVKDIEKTLRYCEYAAENGIYPGGEITEEQISYGLSLMEGAPYSVMDIAASVTEDDIADAMELALIAEKAEEHLTYSLTYGITDEEINSRYENNRYDYDVIDYVSYTFEVSLEDIEKDESASMFDDPLTAYENAVAQSKKDAQTLSEITSLEAFSKYITEREGVGASGISEYTHLRQKKSALPDEIADWAFVSSVGSTYVAEDNDKDEYEYSVTVYMLTSTPYALKTKNFSYINFSDQATAQSAINAYHDGTISSFEELSDMYPLFEYKTITNYDETTPITDTNSIITTYPIGGSVSGDKFYYSYSSDGAVTIAPKRYTVTGGDSDASYYVTYSKDFADKYYVSAGNGTANDYFAYSDSALEKYVYSSSIGSLIVSPNATISSFSSIGSQELLDWVFDEKRAEGDVTSSPIGNISTGFYVARFDGDGEYSWYISIKNELVTEALDRAVAELAQRYSVNVLSNAADIIK